MKRMLLLLATTGVVACTGAQAAAVRDAEFNDDRSAWGEAMGARAGWQSRSRDGQADVCECFDLPGPAVADALPDSALAALGLGRRRPGACS